MLVFTVRERRNKSNSNTFTGYYDESNKFFSMADLLVVVYSVLIKSVKELSAETLIALVYPFIANISRSYFLSIIFVA